MRPHPPLHLCPCLQAEAVLAGMGPTDMSLTLDAFARWGHPLPPSMLQQIEGLTLQQLQDQRRRRRSDLGGDEAASEPIAGGEPLMSPSVLLQLLGGMTASGASPSDAWLSAWSALLDVEAVRQLGSSGPAEGQALQLVELLAHDRLEGFRPSAK